MEQDGSCEGSYRNSKDGRIYKYMASFHGGPSIVWSADVSWGDTPTFTRSGSISHNRLSGQSLQALVRAHIEADLQQALARLP